MNYQVVGEPPTDLKGDSMERKRLVKNFQVNLKYAKLKLKQQMFLFQTKKLLGVWGEGGEVTY